MGQYLLEHTMRKLVLLGLSVLLLTLPTTFVAADSDSQPTSFQFYFNGPARGLRLWSRSGESWTETYPSGQKGTFRVRKVPYTLKGTTGTLVEKVDEPDFFVFIPDLRSKKMEVWTYKGKGPWLFLAGMKEVQPGTFD
jgi:hypothetical protein